MVTHALYAAHTLRQIEQTQIAAGAPLMARAGLAAATWIMARFAPDIPITVLAGPGNNGGDGFTVARHLKQAGYAVRVHYTGKAASAPAPTTEAIALWQQVGGRLDERWQPDHGVVIDALYGIGLSRNIPAAEQQLFAAIVAAGQYVIALDIPSGLHADTGAILGAALPAQATLTFIGDKPGLHTANGRDHAGEVFVFDLDIPQQVFPAAGIELYCPKRLPTALHRRHESHKGSYGTVGVIGGAEGMTGAALLAGRAALKLGAGKVHVGLLTPNLNVDPLYPELMLGSAVALATGKCDIRLLGPGLGQSEAAAELVMTTLRQKEPLIIDADALNLIARDTLLAAACQARHIPAIITPHPTEAARLLALTTAEIQADRLSAARALAEKYHCIVVLKGSGTVVCDQASTTINASGNAALAAAGQGDILGGMVSALLAQGLGPIEAARLGVFVHGAAADLWKKQASNQNGIGLTAGETVDCARTVLNQLA